MQRCLQLAELGRGHVAPNPVVGAVLVHGQRIIGEGYHKIHGGPHAEVGCFASVSKEDKPLLAQATLYVSLEPCAHFGKTPPCADLIIGNKVADVVVGCTDPFPAVAGKGVAKLKAAGINVTLGVLQNECIYINRRFFTFHKKQRPFIILKWAQTANGTISGANGARIKISNEFSDREVHRWRSEESAILVGTNTALMDDPALTTRLVPGKNPLRIVIDKELRLPASLQLFDRSVPTIVFNTIKSEESTNLSYVQLESGEDFLPQLLNELYKRQIQSLIVEGGSAVLQSFINEGLWDEARVITNHDMHVPSGTKAPLLLNETLYSTQDIGSDSIRYYKQ